MTDAEILRLKLNLEDSLLDENSKEEFLATTDDFHDFFSLRDEIGTCPFIEVHLKFKDENTILCMTLSYERRTKESHSKRNGQIGTFRYYLKKGLTSYSSLVVLVK